MRGQQEFFADIQDLQKQQQFRMRRLQVFNWGTFSDLHDIDIAEQGFLLVGRSGSGKSTLLDALSALLIPPQWQVFNAAAREGERNRRDRNMVTYVRGAWGEQKDVESGEIASQFLRRSTTWSALALSFANQQGRVITLIHLYWLKGSSTASTDVKRHFMIAERTFDIATELGQFDLDVRALKNHLHDVEHFGDTFRPYAERFRRLMSIESEMALKLLHKTQSAKNLGDLNDFLREFMLDEPETFKAADRLIAEFVELDAAHQEVVTARQQVETLTPARVDYEALAALNQSIHDNELLLASMEDYCEHTRHRLLTEEIDRLNTQHEGLSAQQVVQQEQVDRLKQTLEVLMMQHREQGGAEIDNLQQRLRDAERQRDERMVARSRAEQACRVLGGTLPADARQFSERVAEARDTVEAWRDGQDMFDSRRDALRDRDTAASNEFAEVRQEIDALERQPSNIPAHMLELRSRMAEALGFGESELPFVGELIQVRSEEASWQGAIERVLHGFAMSLLVDENRYAAVARYVDETHLSGKLVYYRFGKKAAGVALEPGLQSLCRKVELKQTVHQDWLIAELQRRFDYTCVDTLRDFRQLPRALTQQGQMRHGPDRHEKDDRYRVDDRRRWVLGFDNREKLLLYRQRAQALAQVMSELQGALAALKQERSDQQEKVQASMTLSNLAWQQIDVGSSLDNIQEITQLLQQLSRGNSALHALDQRIGLQRANVSQAERSLQQVSLELMQVSSELDKCVRQQHIVSQKLQDLVSMSDAQQQALDDLFRRHASITLDTLDARRIKVERAINDELKRLRDDNSQCTRRIEKAFDTFKREWPAATADFEATLVSAAEYMALLQQLEWDGLPQHEKRFFDMLREQSSENLAALNTHLSQARKDIALRMELVNEGLADAEFNPGTHLQIEVGDRHLPEIRDFRELVARVLNNAWQADSDSAEQRFLTLRNLVRRLEGPEPEQQRWRNLVLDVRLHMEFIGKELDAAGNVLEVYRSGAGKSGGQREKLSTTCLAAALRYQLGGSDGGLPVYAPVVLDEAFGKADNEFTELVMRIFEKFGFQMIVATPLKSVMTLEPFIGGACFVEIADRKRSATLAIEYDTTQQRLNFPTAQAQTQSEFQAET